MTLIIVLVLVTFASMQIPSALADQAVVSNITPWTRQSDSHTILNITVVHNGYYSGHYVNWVEVNVSGTVNTINLVEPQPDPSFIVQYDMGVVVGTPTVQARANCTIHGSYGWSSTVQVPEFYPIVLLATLVGVTSISLVLSRRSIGKRRSG